MSAVMRPVPRCGWSWPLRTDRVWRTVVGEQFTDATSNHCSSNSPTVVRAATRSLGRRCRPHCELALGLGPVRAHGLGPIAALPRRRIGSCEHAQLEGPGAALTDRSVNDQAGSTTWSGALLPTRAYRTIDQ